MRTDDAHVKLIAGEYQGKRGPVKDLYVDVEYFDVKLDGMFNHPTKKRTVLVYCLEGSLRVCDSLLKDHYCALLDAEGDVEVRGKGRFLFIAGDPLGEAVAWGGPIVMNTEMELREAFQQLEDGTFISKCRDAHPEYYDD